MSAPKMNEVVCAHNILLAKESEADFASHCMQPRSSQMIFSKAKSGNFMASGYGNDTNRICSSAAWCGSYIN